MKISTRDWVKLSAFLDGELDAREANTLEARMAREPGLQAALEDLRRTKQVLSHTPTLKVPRSFTLAPSQVGIKRSRTSSLGYSWAAAALSILFIAVIAIDLGTGASKGALTAAVAPRSEQLLPEAAMEAAPADQIESEPSLMAAEEALEADNAADQEAAMAQEVPAEEGPAAEESSSLLQATPELEAGQAKTAPQATEISPEAEGQTGLGQEPEGELGLPPTPGADLAEQRYDQAPENELTPLVEGPRVPWIRILEVLLGLGAAGSGAAAILQRRRRSRS